MKAESKAIIFGRYSNIDTIIVWQEEDKIIIGEFLPLKPLSSISDEDAKLVNADNSKQFLRFLSLYELPYKDYDTLRQIGYATPQTVIEDGKVVTYTVEELVKEGVFKLD